jgi:hypothetical protein
MARNGQKSTIHPVSAPQVWEPATAKSGETGAFLARVAETPKLADWVVGPAGRPHLSKINALAIGGRKSSPIDFQYFIFRTFPLFAAAHEQLS